MKLSEAKDRLFDMQFEMESIENRMERLQFNDPERNRAVKELREVSMKMIKLKRQITEMEGLREV